MNDYVDRVVADRAALLAAADVLRSRWERLCACVDELEPDDMAACSEYRELLDDAILVIVELSRTMAGR